MMPDVSLAELAATATPAPWVLVTDSCDCDAMGDCGHGQGGEWGREFAYAIHTPKHRVWGFGDGDACDPERAGDYLHHQCSEIGDLTIEDGLLICAAREAIPAVLELIARARAISDGDRMTVYVADLEAALGLRPDVAPSKIGQNADGT